MCLGIPGQVVELLTEHEHLAMVDVSGQRRKINLGLLEDEDEDVRVGDWVLIHVGFALLKLSEAEVAQALQSLQMMSEGGADEIEALLPSDVSGTCEATEREEVPWAS